MSSPQSSAFSPETLYRLVLAAPPLPDVEECADRFVSALHDETGCQTAIWIREGPGFDRLAAVPEEGAPARFSADSLLARSLQAAPVLTSDLPELDFGGLYDEDAAGWAAAFRLGALGVLVLHTPDAEARLTDADLDAFAPVVRHLTTALGAGLGQQRRAAEAEAPVSHLHLLHAVLGQQRGTTTEQLQRALALGTDLLGLDIGIVSRVDAGDGGDGDDDGRDDTYTVVACHAPGTDLHAGQTFDVRETYCAITLDTHDVVAIGHMAVSEHAAHPCYEAFELEAYIGIPIHVDGALYGTVNFSGTQPRRRPFSETDRDVLRLLGPWVGALLERERAEAARLRSEARLRSVIDQAPIVLFALDREGVITLSEGQGLAALGLEPGQVVGQSVFDLYGALDEPMAAIRQALGGEPAQWDAQVGEARYENRATPLFDEEGRLDGLIGVSYDVTARHRAERALRDAMARFRRLFSAAPEALFLAEPDHTLSFLNPACERLFGWSSDEVAGQSRRLLYAREEEFGAQTAQASPPDADARLEPGLATFRRKDGRTFLGEAASAPIYDEDDDLLGYVGFVRDVTEREAATRAVTEAKLRLERLFGAAPYAVAYADADRVFRYVNPTYEALFGYTADELIGRNTHMLYADRTGYEETGRYQFNPEQADPSAPRVVAFKRKDGSTFLGEIVGAALEEDDDDAPVGYIGFIRDVTEREAARQAAEEATRAKERFLANMSHEMRTPLNAVLGLSHLLRETPLNEDQTQLLRGVGTAADALLSLIDDLLDFARLEAGKLPFEAVPFRPIELLHDLLRMLRPRADEKGIALRLDLDSAVPETLVGDPNRLRQILMNLLANAVKFTDLGSAVVRVTRLGDPQAHGVDGPLGLRFDVVDTGIGVPAGQLERIFEAFSQARTDSARTHGGTGLGLAIVKELVERQGGRIVVQSREGIGSTFSVILPFAHADREAAPTPSRPSTEATSELDGVRVLLVEDNAMNRFVATRLLERWGVAVEQAVNGHEALDVLARSAEGEGVPFDLVLMDLQMPEMDGIEATHRIREDLGIDLTALPIIALTASVLASQRTSVLSAGFNDFILKPFEPEDLRARLGAHLGRSGGDSLPVPASVNPSLLHRSTLGDPVVTMQLIDMFCTEMPAEVEALTSAVSRSEWAEVRSIAHRAQSQAGYIGAQPLAEALRDIERRIGDGRHDGLAERVEDAVRRAFEAIRELLLLRRRMGLEAEERPVETPTERGFSGPSSEA